MIQQRLGLMRTLRNFHSARVVFNDAPAKRFIQTSPETVKRAAIPTSVTPGEAASKWAKHSLSPRSFQQVSKEKAPLEKKKTTKRKARPHKNIITLSPKAISHLRALLDQPTPQLIRVSVQNRGCSGLTYDLSYIEAPGKYDEVVEQDGVKVIIDSKALFSIVGSEMDWIDDKLSSRFIFRNPNSKGTCGCGESFMV